MALDLTLKKISIVIFAIFITSVLTVFLSARADFVSSQSPQQLSLSLKFSRKGSTFNIGDAILSQPIFINHTSTNLFVWEHDNFWTNHLLLLVDAKGNEPPLTDLGRRAKDTFFRRLGWDRSDQKMIEPGREYNDLEIDLSRYFSLPEGDYSVALLYNEMAWMGNEVRGQKRVLNYPSPHTTLISETVHFKVKAKD